MNKQFHNQGYMKVGLWHVISYAFFKLKLHRIEANVQPDNIDSISLFDNCGFRDECFSKNYLRVDGKWRDHRRFAITLEDWDTVLKKFEVK